MNKMGELLQPRHPHDKHHQAQLQALQPDSYALLKAQFTASNAFEEANDEVQLRRL